jgi:hypothetical protein
LSACDLILSLDNVVYRYQLLVALADESTRLVALTDHSHDINDFFRNA